MEGFMKINERVVDGIQIFDITGRVVSDDRSADQLQDKITQLAGRGHNKLILNLAAVTYIDETGLSAIARSYTIVSRREGGKLRLLNPEPRVNEALVRTQLASLLGTYSNEQDAIRSFNT
jgi:anti-sigma B factor antagonist